MRETVLKAAVISSIVLLFAAVVVRILILLDCLD